MPQQHSNAQSTSYRYTAIYTARLVNSQSGDTMGGSRKAYTWCIRDSTSRLSSGLFSHVAHHIPCATKHAGGSCACACAFSAILLRRSSARSSAIWSRRGLKSRFRECRWPRNGSEIRSLARVALATAAGVEMPRRTRASGSLHVGRVAHTVHKVKHLSPTHPTPPHRRQDELNRHRISPRLVQQRRKSCES